MVIRDDLYLSNNFHDFLSLFYIQQFRSNISLKWVIEYIQGLKLSNRIAPNIPESFP